MKSICMFCGKEHRTKKPKLCAAKGQIMSSYARKVGTDNLWKIFHLIETGEIDLDREAKKLLKA